MDRTLKLLEKARRAPGRLSFSELCRLIVGIGYQLRRQKGSHRVYSHGTVEKLPIINVQNDKGKAKPYQVRQVLQVIEENELL